MYTFYKSLFESEGTKLINKKVVKNYLDSLHLDYVFVGSLSYKDKGHDIDILLDLKKQSFERANEYVLSLAKKINKYFKIGIDIFIDVKKQNWDKDLYKYFKDYDHYVYSSFNPSVQETIDNIGGYNRTLKYEPKFEKVDPTDLPDGLIYVTFLDDNLYKSFIEKINNNVDINILLKEFNSNAQYPEEKYTLKELKDLIQDYKEYIKNPKKYILNIQKNLQDKSPGHYLKDLTYIVRSVQENGAKPPLAPIFGKIQKR